jgi:hypothetical protein
VQPRDPRDRRVGDGSRAYPGGPRTSISGADAAARAAGNRSPGLSRPPAFGLGPIARVAPSPLAAARAAAAPPTMPMGPRAGFGLPNLRRNVCPHFYMSGSRGAIPIQAPHLLKALIRQDTNISRCQLRGGVHLDQGYVNDVCLTPRFNQCVFYEDELSRE